MDNNMKELCGRGIYIMTKIETTEEKLTDYTRIAVSASDHHSHAVTNNNSKEDI
ncbi:uncharacterized protein PHALS_09871 [Plasmopara halstedii]|uniref:Uncharacterized protein n=1 Tax=Plasmopara halstedii TaxID=4781 RepID=A0A0P1AF01_PLAHL|nr:uncharacterized protein PHALS_09871 [Plasmopara halstedii]CEG39633.1 hypothetical protein PHALS_09871 [Plasmopara halstedii]|eukprot:XP_024576002.1 hypothetical protein PHALS_09871 [Plasmopara halstedii]